MASTPELTIYEKLAEPFPNEVVEWRSQTVNKAGNSALALAYIDARSVMARLDETVGPQNWKDTYRDVGGRIVCCLSLRIDGEWIGKEDGSGDTNFEGEKGAISGALKRAAVKWGIGRYLYDVDAIWADCTSYEQNRGGKTVRVFKDWTAAGERALAEALRRAPGPRQTGKPFSVDKTLEAIERADSLDELRRIFEANWAMIPLDYRREVLGAKDARKVVLQQKNERNEENGRAE